MDKKNLRKNTIMEMLRENKRLDISTVVKKLNICEATARRIFSTLESEGLLIRVHGGIQLVPQMEADYSYRISAVKQKQEKKAIGKAAADVVESGDKIFIDSGTTVLRMAEALATRIRRKEITNITVLTNSLTYSADLSEQCKVILIGGEIRPQRRDVCGPVAETILSHFCFDKVFFGADAISLTGSLMAIDEITAKMNEIVLTNSSKNYLLATSNKIGKKSFIKFTNLDKKTTFFTDNKVSSKMLKELKKTKAKIIACPS